MSLVRSARGKWVDFDALELKARNPTRVMPATEEVRAKVAEVAQRIQSGYIPAPVPEKTPAEKALITVGPVRAGKAAEPAPIVKEEGPSVDIGDVKPVEAKADTKKAS